MPKRIEWIVSHTEGRFPRVGAWVERWGGLFYICLGTGLIICATISTVALVIGVINQGALNRAAADNFTSRRAASISACKDRENVKTDTLLTLRYFAGRFGFASAPGQLPRRADGTRVLSPLRLTHEGQQLVGTAACPEYARRSVPSSSNQQ